ncbi:MAG: hypothetical protein FJY10_07095 [Bacteroidetes bacterium]|nr:hypothetical protein [Bacteroidota bacterium]
MRSDGSSAWTGFRKYDVYAERLICSHARIRQLISTPSWSIPGIVVIRPGMLSFYISMGMYGFITGAKPIFR